MYMEAIILSNDQYQALFTRLEDISKNMANKGNNPDEFVDNNDFLQLMKVSKRTAQSWRDEGKIAFSQIGGKIYYRMTDIHELLKQHYNHAFAPNFKNKSVRKL